MCGGVVASWLVSSPPDRAFKFKQWLETLCCALAFKTLNYHSASLHPSLKWILTNLMLGVTLSWTSIPSGRIMLQILG